MAKKKIIKKKRLVATHRKSLQELLEKTVSLIRQKPHAFGVGLIVMLLLLIGASGLLLTTCRPAKPLPQAVGKKKPTLVPALTPVVTPTTTPIASTKKYYTVQENQRLWDIAAEVYGNPYLYTKLVELNNLPNPDAVPAGTKLLLE